MLPAMTTRRKKLAGVLAGAVVLSSGAYALGSQAGGGGALASGANAASATGAGQGTASAPRDRAPRGLVRRGGFGLGDLADRLGVSQTALRTALEALRTSKTPAQRRAEVVQALAGALGKPVDQVTAAVNSVLPDRPGRKADLAAAIARELGVDTAKVQSALDRVRREHGTRRDRDRDRNGAGRRGGDLVNAISSASGADAAKVRAALARVRPDRRDRRAARDDVRQRLAGALKVTPAQLDAALDKVRSDERDAFATALARRLNIDVAKVKSVLRDLPRGGGRHHG
jgi:transcriptional regulator with XRE-family HTH domain